jgi:hypothetical protein
MSFYGLLAGITAILALIGLSFSLQYSDYSAIASSYSTQYLNTMKIDALASAFSFYYGSENGPYQFNAMPIGALAAADGINISFYGGSLVATTITSPHVSLIYTGK